MTRLAALAAAAASLALMAAGPASAASKAKVRKVIEQAGLMGWWTAGDCTKAPDVDNAWERFWVDETGQVFDADYEGEDGHPTYVVDARRLPNGDIRIRTEVEKGEPDLTLTYRIEGNRQRIWTSRNAEGTLVVDQGRWTNTSEVGGSIWYTRCPGPPPEP